MHLAPPCGAPAVNFSAVRHARFTARRIAEHRSINVTPEDKGALLRALAKALKDELVLRTLTPGHCAI